MFSSVSIDGRMAASVLLELGGSLLDEIHHDVLVSCVPVSLRHPVLAIPLRDAAAPTALVVLWCNGEGRDQTLGIEVSDFLHSLLKFLCRHRLSEFLECNASSL